MKLNRKKPSWQLLSSIRSTIVLFTSIVSRFSGVFGLFSLLRTAKWISVSPPAFSLWFTMQRVYGILLASALFAWSILMQTLSLSTMGQVVELISEIFLNRVENIPLKRNDR